MAYSKPAQNHIALRRNELGLTQEDVAKALDVRRSQVSLWENGHQAPEGRNLLGLARLLKRTPEWVLDPTAQQLVLREGSDESDYDLGSVPIHGESGAPIEDEIEEILSWVPEDMSRRWTKHVTLRARMGEIRAYAVRANWTMEKIERVRAAIRRLDALQQGEDPNAGAGGGP